MAQSGIAGRRKAAMAEGGEAYKSRRDEIIRVAADVFKERGYEAATLNDIAERLDTDRASLYYYVGSKEELVHEIIRSMLDQNVATAERVASQGGSAQDKLITLIEDMIESFDRNYPHMYVHIEDLARIARLESDWAREVLRSMRRFESIVIGILEEGRTDGSFRSDLPSDLSAFALFGMVNWTHRWYKPGEGHDPKEIATTFAAIFLDGYNTKRRTRRT
jgi:AcrR family transcriptional regulator